VLPVCPSWGFLGDRSNEEAAYPFFILLHITPMGQQQLLILVLCVITVGAAIGIGLALISDAQRAAARDALVQEGLRLITDLQVWKATAVPYGGGQGSAGYAAASFDAIGIAQATYPHGLGGTFYFHERPSGCYVLVTRGTNVPEGGFLLGAYAPGTVERCTPAHVFEGVLFSKATAVATVTGARASDVTWRFPRAPRATAPLDEAME